MALQLQTRSFLPNPFSPSSSSSCSFCYIPTACITKKFGTARTNAVVINSKFPSSPSNDKIKINNGVWKKRLSAASASGSGSSGVPNSNYVVPLDLNNSSVITRPLNEILRDLNKRVPDNIIDIKTNCIPWYHANRLLSFYAPGWCGEISDVIFSENGSVTVIYRVTIRGSDGEAHRESSGTVSSSDGRIEDPVAAAEELAFCRACARFGLGLYLYHEDEME